MDAPKKIFLSFFVIILSSLVILVTSFSTTTPKETRTKATGVSSNAVSLILVPNEGAYRVSETFDVQIYLNTFDVAASGVGARLLFDPRFLEVVQVLPGNIFGTYPAASFDSGQGTINLSGIAFNTITGQPSQSFTGTGVFGTIKFRARAESTLTSVRFNFTSGGRTDDSNVMDAKTSVDALEKVYNATFTINP